MYKTCNSCKCIICKFSKKMYNMYVQQKMYNMYVQQRMYNMYATVSH